MQNFQQGERKGGAMSSVWSEKGVDWKVNVAFYLSSPDYFVKGRKHTWSFIPKTCSFLFIVKRITADLEVLFVASL